MINLLNILNKSDKDTEMLIQMKDSQVNHCSSSK